MSVADVEDDMDEFEGQVAKTLSVLHGVYTDIGSKAMAIEQDAGKTKAILWGFVKYIEGKDKKPLGGDNQVFQQLRGVEELIDIHNKMMDKRRDNRGNQK